MGPNSKRAQAASAASRNTPSRARFSKPPPSKKKGGRGGRGRGGGRGGNDNGGRGEGRGRGRGGGRGNNRNSKPPSNATRANVIDKLSKRVHDKAKKRSEGTSKKAKASNHPLAGLDKSKLDEVVLSDELIQIVSKLLTDLNVMESTPNSSYHGEMKYGDSNDMSVDGDDESIDSNDVEGDKSPLIKDTPLFIHLTTQLSFSEDNAQRACAWSNLNNDQEVKANGNGNGNETSLADEMGLAMDWLCLHLSEDELKQGFKLNKNRNMKKSSSKTALSIQSVNTGAVRSIAHPSISVPSDKNWRESMSQQTRMLGFVRLGFHQSESIRACSEIKDVEVTHNPLEDVASIKLLLSMLEKEFLGGYVTTHDSLSAADLTYVESERKQEEEALRAIFEDKFKIRSEDCNQGLGQRYTLSIEPNDDLQQPARAEESKLIVLIRPGYPVFCPPLLLFTNPTLPPSLLRRINIAIIEEAHQNVGEPIVFSIVHFLSENLCDMQREFSEELRAKETKSEIVGVLDHPRGTTNGSVEAQEEKAHSDENLDSSKLDFMETLRRKIANVTIDGDRTDKKLNMKVESSNRSRTSHVPKPVAVPTGDLGVIMKDIAKVQTAQPWLVSPDARVPVRDTKSSDLTSTQRREQSKISNKLRNDLERWNQAAEQWSEKGGKFGKNECKMLSQRKRLPAYKVKEKIVKTIASNQITVISGDTGSGKTTQVPQLVLDDMISNNKGSEANIIVTQPRRISAIGVSERIASERCERVGETVGYSIRLENKRSSKTRLLLCTTGILLRRLQCDPDLASVSHVFVDEVHERDLNTDFLLIILKDLLLRRKNLKLVLMSATLNADTFSSYFGGSPTVSIPGRTHPVVENRLEDVLALTGYEVKEGSDYALRKNSKKTRLTKSDLKKMYPNYDAKVHSSLAIADESVINYELIACLLEHIALHQEDGAILVFLPGMMEITKTIEELQKLEFFQDQSKTVIYPLHSSLSTAEQTAVFQVPQEGIRKIVVATNIAETSITIEDVVYVVDAGRVKENRQDEVNQMMTLVECWVSRASAKQRRGRAGRVRPGISYHLYSTHTNRDDMQEYQLPEMLRVGLEDLVLQILLLDLGEPSIFLTKAVNPPSALAIRNSLKLLEGLGAVDCDWDENEVKQKDTKLGSNESSCQILSVNSGLTALGFHLATLPVDPRVGKMMIYGALFGCIDPALTIAASMSARNPFMSPFDKRAEADAARKNFAIEGSDHLTTLNAFNQWKQMRTKKGDRAAQSFLRDSFLSRMTLFQMEDLRKQFAKLLVDIGFLPKGFRLPNSLGRGQESTSTAVQNATNANCNNMHLVKAVLCAGLYPNIIVAPKNDKKGAGGMSAFQSLKGDVYLHPSTISFSEKKLESRYCCYHEIVKTTKSFVRDATPVSEFALLLFGGNLKVYHTHGVVTLDDWLKFRISAKPATLVKHLRAQMEKMLLRKIITPEDDVIGSSEGKSLIQAVSTLFEREIKEVPNTALEDNEGRRESNNDRIPEGREHHSSSSYAGKEQNTRGGNRHDSGHSARGGGRGRKNDSYGGRGGGRGRGRGGRR